MCVRLLRLPSVLGFPQSVPRARLPRLATSHVSHHARLLPDTLLPPHRPPLGVRPLALPDGRRKIPGPAEEWWLPSYGDLSVRDHDRYPTTAVRGRRLCGATCKFPVPWPPQLPKDASALLALGP